MCDRLKRETMPIEPRELLAEIERGAAPLIIDVRSRAEFERGHVPGARHVPFWRVWAAAPVLALKPDAPIVVYCGHGPRAYLAGSTLRRLGFQTITYLSGHMARWTREGLPTEHGADDRTRS
jgi:rhodanese-related sulfurtransferase